MSQSLSLEYITGDIQIKTHGSFFRGEKTHCQNVEMGTGHDTKQRQWPDFRGSVIFPSLTEN